MGNEGTAIHGTKGKGQKKFLTIYRVCSVVVLYTVKYPNHIFVKTT